MIKLILKSLVLTVFILSSFSNTTLCQEQNKKDNPDRVKVITLSSYNVKQPDKLPFPISNIEVITSLWDTTHLGYVQVGAGNKMIRASFDQPIQQALQAHVDEKYKTKFTADGKKLLWMIQDLRINERTSGLSEKAFVYLHADAYISSGDDSYSYATTLDTVLDKLTAADVTHKHGNNIAEALNLLLIKTLAAGTINNETVLSKEQIKQRSTDRFDIPALMADSIRQGLYMTFEDFKNNKPTIDSFLLQNDKRKIALFQINPDGSRQKLEKPWGICYKGEVYRYFNGNLITLERVDNSFVISDYLDMVNRRNKSIFLGALAGGFAGGLIGGLTGTLIVPTAIGSSGNKLYEVTGFRYIRGVRPEASAINMQNGKLMF